jgi:formyl-CoA transferase
VGLSELVNDERFDSVRKRKVLEGVIVPMLREALGKKTALEWESIFGEEVPCSAVRQVEDMFDNPQVQAEEMITSFHHPVVGEYRGFKHPIQFGRTPAPEPFAAPTLGQHNVDIFKGK